MRESECTFISSIFFRMDARNIITFALAALAATAMAAGPTPYGRFARDLLQRAAESAVANHYWNSDAEAAYNSCPDVYFEDVTDADTRW